MGIRAYPYGHGHDILILVEGAEPSAFVPCDAIG